ncbi:MAG TPA: hypothetical protein VKC60_04175, partial [Opitutaceae bacterium]|nr:hypothetical protein [Opitutaceae bacterium]
MISLKLPRVVLAALPFLAAVGATRSYSQAPATTVAPISEPADVTLKLRDDSLDQVLALLERFTGRSVIRPQQLPGATFTFTSQKPMTKSEAIQALESLLTVNQIAAIPLGEKFMIVNQIGLARTEAPEFIEGTSLTLPASGQVATKLFQFDYLRANEIVPQL